MRNLLESWQKYVQEDVDPDAIDLSSFEIQDDLNQKVWVDNNEKMNPEIIKNLLEIVEDFWQWLEIPWVDILDIVLTGSLANYNWSRFSDIDLHIIIDYAQVDENEDLVREYLNAKRALWNREHQIEIHGFEVELYVQDNTEPHASTGLYSVMSDAWILRPSRSAEDFDESQVRLKASGLMDEIDRIEDLFDEEKYDLAISSVERLKDKIRRMRKTGLETGGAFSVENLAFKVLRREDYLAKLNDIKRNAYDRKMSIHQ